MYCTTKQLADGLTLFAETEMLPALKGWKLWAGAAALSLAAQRSEPLLAALAGSPVVSALGLVGSDGMVDVDALTGAVKDAIRAQGKFPLDIPVLDIEYEFAEKDIDTLRACIEQAAGVSDQRRTPDVQSQSPDGA